jgi:hypothetical protein
LWLPSWRVVRGFVESKGGGGEIIERASGEDGIGYLVREGGAEEGKVERGWCRGG